MIKYIVIFTLKDRAQGADEAGEYVGKVPLDQKVVDYKV
jgi:hypothetical protein